jgi:dipeptidyl aminopeptidase/acylaminoacyl peptidase
MILTLRSLPMRHSCIPALLLTTMMLAGGGAFGQAPSRIEQGTLIYDGIPAAAMHAPESLAGWLDARGAMLVDWLADGSLLVSRREGDTTQLQRVRKPLAAPEPLTRDAEPITSAAAHPYDANLVVYRKDHGGDGNTQLWLRDLMRGSEKLLTDGRSRHGPPVFAHDGRRIAYNSNARDPAGTDILMSDVGSEAATRLVLAGNDEDLEVQGWSLDDARLAVIRRRSPADSELLLVDVATGNQTRVEPSIPKPTRGRGGKVPSPAAVGMARFARDGRGLYLTSDRGGEFMALHYFDLYTKQLTTLTPDTRWDVERFDLSQDGRFLAYTLNEAGLSRLVLRDLRLRADLLLPPQPSDAVIDNLVFDRRSDRLAVAVQTASSPPEVFVYDIIPGDAGVPPTLALTRWTQGELAGINPAKLVAARLVSFPTWDETGGRRRQLSAFVYRPGAPGPHPVIIDIHGGPAAQFRPRWDAFRQYLVGELGYVVIAPNVRGSSGYGRSFLQLDDGALREDSLRDIGALLVWLGAQRDFDRSRVVVAGDAYGGYLALASLVQYGDRLVGGIDVAGISNFVSFLGGTSGYHRDLRRLEFGDERDPQMRALLTAISPLTNAASIRKPLLIVQGQNDPLVPASESEQMRAVVRANGGEVWYLAAKDEGHGFARKMHVDAWQAAAVAFLKQLAPLK